MIIDFGFEGGKKAVLFNSTLYDGPWSGLVWTGVCQSSESRLM